MEDEHLLTNERVIKANYWKHRFIEHNLKDKLSKSAAIARMVVTSIILIVVGANAFTGFLLQKWHVGCMWDGGFHATVAINGWFAKHNDAKDTVLIISSFVIDLLLLSLLFRFMLYGISWRPVICLGMFYAFRAFIQTIFIMTYPDKEIWEYPGFPSFAVSYEMSSDFFFSGHVGVVTMLALENREADRPILMWIAIMSIFIEFCVMLFLRGHYTIDLYTGIIVGHYTWILSGKLSPYIDRKLGLTSLDQNRSN